MRKLLVGLGLLGLLMLGTPRGQAQAGGPCTVPKSWGRLASISSYSRPLGAGRTYEGVDVAFEAADGTVRVVDLRCDTPPRAAVILRSEN